MGEQATVDDLCWVFLSKKGSSSHSTVACLQWRAAWYASDIHLCRGWVDWKFAYYWSYFLDQIFRVVALWYYMFMLFILNLGSILDLSFGAVTRWPWLFAVYRGWETTQLYCSYRNYDMPLYVIRIPPWTNHYNLREIIATNPPVGHPKWWWLDQGISRKCMPGKISFRNYWDNLPS